jgi:hypothetical protein
MKFDKKFFVHFVVKIKRPNFFLLRQFFAVSFLGQSKN